MPDADLTGLMNATDDDLAAALEDADLPSLLPALAYLTGDMGLVEDPRLRPQTRVVGAMLAPQGGMSAQTQALAKLRALVALRSLRDSGRIARHGGDPTVLRRLMNFITGDVEDDYEPLLVRELGLAASMPDRPAKPPARSTDSFSVVVIGAGMSGLAAAYRLEQAGLPFTVIERNADVGGVWLENDYPGCRLDTSNFAYSYSFAQKSDWPHEYSARGDIHGYFRDFADRLALGDRILFGTEVVRAEYHEARCTWRLTTRSQRGQEQVLEANAVVSAVGQLNQPSIPDFPGQEQFAGDSFHTARWNHKVDLRGKRVAVIGTGASAYQVVPSIADDVDRLYVFQRNAPWALPAPMYHKEIQPGLKWLFQNMPYYHRWFRFSQFWFAVDGMRRFAKVDPDWQRTDSVSEANHHLRQALEHHIREQYVDRPDLVEKVIPDYPPYSKRMLRDNGVWAATLKSPHVRLVTEQITAITETGVRTLDGTEHEVDVIVYGTGFKASDFLPSITVVGRDGMELHEWWQGDPRAYLGIAVPGFPNFFCLYGPNTNLVLNGSIILFSELAMEYVVQCIDMLLADGVGAMECRPEPFDAYNAYVDAGNESMAWGLKHVNNWYKSASGRVSQNWPYSTFEYWQVTQAPRREDYIFTSPASRRELNRMAGQMTNDIAVPRWVRAGSFRTRYFEWGEHDAPTVLLLHDGAWGGSAPVTWGALAEPLARDFRVIAPDMLGFGGSDKAVFLGESPYGFRIRHILQLLRCLCVDGPVHVVGNSFGGSVALRAAAELSGDQISSVTSINGSGGPWRTDLALAELGHWDGTDTDMARMVQLLIDEGPWFDAHVKLRAEAAGNKGHYRAVKAPTIPVPEQLLTPEEVDDWPTGLANRDFPILLVAGSRDRLLEHDWMAKLQAGESNFTNVELDCKHAPNIDQVRALMDVMHPFLKRA